LNNKDKPFESIIDNLQKKPVKKRVETMNERIERMHHMYDNGPKPKHYDDKSIVDMEKWNSMKGLEKKTPVVQKPTNRSIQDQVIDYSPNKVQRPKPFNNMDKSTYPSNQKKAMSTWEIMVDQAKKPKDRQDRESAKQTREIIMKNYRNKNMRKYLGDDELKLIGKHKSQQNYPEVTIPKVDINYKPYVPEPSGPSLAEVMKNSARMKPGLSEDLIGINAQIKKNIDYVLGKKEEKSESVNEKNINNKEETYD